MKGKTLENKTKDKFLQTNGSQLKYLAIAIVVGLSVGAIDAIFGRVLIAITSFREQNYLFLLPVLPLAGIFIIWVYNRVSPLSLKGMSLVFEVGQKEREDIPMALIPLVMVCTWITHLFGGSAGREGVAVQIGATLSHGIGRKLKISDDNRILLVVGMAAGFGGLFQTPLAALFFALEVIVVGKMAYEALLPAFVASYIASFTSHFLGLEKFSVKIKETLDFSNPKILAGLVVLGVVFGLVGRVFAFSLSKSKKIIGQKIENPYKKIGICGIFLAIVLIILFSGRYSGLGTNLISNSFSDGKIYQWDWILKLILTICTLAIGFQGGEVTPLFSIGASLGIVIGNYLGISPIVAAALGYAAVFGSATNTIIAPIIIGLEVFGSNNIEAFFIVCIVAYIVNGNISIYGSQKILENR